MLATRVEAHWTFGGRAFSIFVKMLFFQVVTTLVASTALLAFMPPSRHAWYRYAPGMIGTIMASDLFYCVFFGTVGAASS